MKNIFRIKISLTVWILLGFVVLCTLGGLGYNVYNLISFAQLDVFKVVIFSVLSVICLLLSVYAISLIANCVYKIKGEVLYTTFGLFSNKIEISSITRITYFEKEDKLILYYQEDKYCAIMISSEKYDEFTQILKQINPSITYDKSIGNELA